jgi:hypothetical protein
MNGLSATVPLELNNGNMEGNLVKNVEAWASLLNLATACV